MRPQGNWYLSIGKTIDQHLSRNQHISNISNKANSVGGFLQCNNISSCSMSVKESCYMTMIRSVLEYASPVWSPSTEHNISKLQMVQRRATRFVKKFYRYLSVSIMINQLGWPMFKRRKTKPKLLWFTRSLTTSYLWTVI